MSISYNVLGKPGKDNALFVRINSGKRFYRLLFDCGESVLSSLEQGEIRSIDYVFFSHFHVDHIAGFDYLFRRIYDRERPVYIFGPPGLTAIIFNRLNGFTWNLLTGSPGEWIINEIHQDKIHSSTIKASDSFSKISSTEIIPSGDGELSNSDFEVRAFFLNHRIPCAGYIVKEKETYNIDKEKLAQLGITPGEWLQKVKDEHADKDEVIFTGGRTYSVRYLKELLLKMKEGDSLAYMTDFIYDQETDMALNLIRKCDTLICESQYLDEDRELALQNYHITNRQAAELARKAEVDKLILFHVSDRYRRDDLTGMLEDARQVFRNTSYPDGWDV